MTVCAPTLNQPICWHPHFYDLITMEAEQVNGSNTWLARTPHDVRVHGQQVAIAEHVLNCELLARELDLVLDHRLFQRRKTFRTVGIVVLAFQVDALLISFIDAACHYELQEFHGCLLAGVIVYYKRALMVSFSPGVFQDDRGSASSLPPCLRVLLPLRA